MSTPQPAPIQPCWTRWCPRRELAQAHNVPAYVVFHDATLYELARLRPGDESALRQVSGIGEHKLARYGARLLEVLRAAAE
jgi:ATP-dependent DNA helicase RecQ